MITPFFSISARPTLIAKDSAPVRPAPLPFPSLILVPPSKSSNVHADRAGLVAREPLAHETPDARHAGAEIVRAGHREREPQPVRRAPVVVELRARREEHARADRVGEEIARVDRARQLDPHLVAALGSAPARAFRQLLRERLEQGVAPLAHRAPQAT